MSDNVTGGQQGQPAPDAVIEVIVAFEESLSTTQIIVPDAWIGLTPGSCSDAEGDARRAQIARGQKLFNAQNAGSRSCRGCHNSVSDGTNVNNTLFDIQTASAAARTLDLPLYTVRNRTTGETRQLTDMGEATSRASETTSVASTLRPDALSPRASYSTTASHLHRCRASGSRRVSRRIVAALAGGSLGPDGRAPRGGRRPPSVSVTLTSSRRFCPLSRAGGAPRPGPCLPEARAWPYSGGA
jgi:hypothetical protein